MVTSLPSLSLSLSLCISLSLSPKVPHAQYRKRFRASYNKARPDAAVQPASLYDPSSAEPWFTCRGARTCCRCCWARASEAFRKVCRMRMSSSSIYDQGVTCVILLLHINTGVSTSFFGITRTPLRPPIVQGCPENQNRRKMDIFARRLPPEILFISVNAERLFCKGLVLIKRTSRCRLSWPCATGRDLGDGTLTQRTTARTANDQ